MKNNTSYQLNHSIYVYHTIDDILKDISELTIKYCLFLDIDGTLAAFQEDPSQCFIPIETLQNIKDINQHSVSVIAVTGRDLQAAKKLLNPINIPIAGLHGLDIYLDENNNLSTHQVDINFAEIYQNILTACTPYPSLLIENKEFSIALHYRKCPELVQTAQRIMQDIKQNFPQLALKEGKFVLELISKEANKGSAIEKILNHFNQPDIIPIFIGDDKTDEDGFERVNKINNGISIKVGEGHTQARYRLKNIEQVADFLELFLNHIKNPVLSKSYALHGEKICLN